MASFRYIVSDVDASVSFYCRLLGFSLKQQFGPAMAIVKFGELEVWLAGPAASASKPMPDGRQPEPGGWARIVVPVDDIDAAVAALTSAGTKFRNQIVSGPGGQQILCEDPSGNVIELFQAADK